MYSDSYCCPATGLITPSYFTQINELPKPSCIHKTLRELRIGTYDNIETADEETSIITALHKFVERRVSALPLVDSEGRLVDIYAKFDVIVSSTNDIHWHSQCHAP